MRPSHKPESPRVHRTARPFVRPGAGRTAQESARSGRPASGIAGWPSAYRGPGFRPGPSTRSAQRSQSRRVRRVLERPARWHTEGVWSTDGWSSTGGVGELAGQPSGPPIDPTPDCAPRAEAPSKCASMSARNAPAPPPLVLPGLPGGGWAAVPSPRGRPCSRLACASGSAARTPSRWTLCTAGCRLLRGSPMHGDQHAASQRLDN